MVGYCLSKDEPCNGNSKKRCNGGRNESFSKSGDVLRHCYCEFWYPTKEDAIQNDKIDHPEYYSPPSLVDASPFPTDKEACSEPKEQEGGVADSETGGVGASEQERHMNGQEIEKMLELHGLWLRGRKTGVKAYLSKADLRGADLTGVNLRGADLTGADLRGADLSGAYLGGANLTGADLRGADLRGAYLTCANLRGADLRGAYLTGANLDFSVWPFHCGSFGARVDYRLVSQLVAHITRLDIDDEQSQKVVDALMPFANDFCKYRGDIKPIASPISGCPVSLVRGGSLKERAGAYDGGRGT